MAVWISGFFRNTGIANPQENNLLIYTLIFLCVGAFFAAPS